MLSGVLLLCNVKLPVMGVGQVFKFDCIPVDFSVSPEDEEKPRI